MDYKYDLPNGWIVNEAQDYCVKVADGTHDSPKKAEEGKLLVTSKNIVRGRLDLSSAYYISLADFKEVNRRSKVDKNDVLLSMIGTVGLPCLIEEDPDFAIKNVGLLKNSDPNKAKWLFFYLCSPQAQTQIKERLRGTTQQYLPLGEIRKFPIPYPEDSSELKQLVNILSALHDKIELNRQINQTLEEIAQAIFKSWFVDFDPVKAKIEAKANGQDPERAAMCAISGKTEEELDHLPPEQLAQFRVTAALFPDELTDSHLGPIPKGWELTLLGEQCEILNGHAFKSNDYVTDGIFVFRTKNFSDSGYSERLPDDVYLPEKFGETHSQFLCEPFDFHVVMVAASIGKTTTILPHHLPALRNQNMWCFRAKHGFPSKIFLNHIVLKIVGEVLGWATGSARSFFRKGDFQKQTIILPDSKLLSAFESLASPMLFQIGTNDLESTNLAQIRDTLLPKLLSGEIELESAPISS